MDRTTRARSQVWFALGVIAALAASVVVTSQWQVGAAPSDGDAATFVSVAPCRLFDHRPAPFTVGNRNVPLSPGETYVQQVTGDVGDCAVPADATAVAMNVTIAQPTAASFLTVFPADVATVPSVSSLNWLAGQAPTPNKVDIQLSPAGRVKLYNRFGQVFVLADVVGYYTATPLDDIRTELADRYHPIYYAFTDASTASIGVGPTWESAGAVRQPTTRPAGEVLLMAANFTVIVPGDAETVLCGIASVRSASIPRDPVEQGHSRGSGWAQWTSPTGGGTGQVTIMNVVGWHGGDHLWKLFCRNLDGGTATITNRFLSVQAADFGGESYPYPD